MALGTSAITLLLLACTAKLDAPGSGPAAPGLGTGGSGAVGGAGTGPGTDPTVCVPGVPQTSRLPRLTNAQYESTVLDLLGVPDTASMLAPDTESVDQRAWDGYTIAASTIAGQVMADAALKAKLLSCAPSGDGAECAAQLIQAFGKRAFRRPLNEAEVARFTRLYTDRAAITATGTFDEAAELIVRAFLLSPSFLLRAETTEAPAGSYLALSGYEVASRLSYMLIGSMPDDALFAAAAAGALATPEQVRAQALRLLEQDPRARGRVTSFHERYLHKGPGTRWAEYQRDPALYPAFSAELVATLSQETDRFLDHVVFTQGGSFKDLVTSPVAFVNAQLAPLYGLDPGQYGAELVQVTLDAKQRPGVFTRAGFLAANAVVNRPSPILRGAFLQKHVLCAPIGSPPPGAEGTALPEVSPTASNRERVSAQTSASECAACHHTFINPTGFVLEGFDAVGRYQPLDQFSGAAVDTAGSIPMDGKLVPVAGPAELFDALAASPAANLCYARSWVQAAYERSITSEDSCVAEALASKLTQGGYRVLDLIADLTQAESFRYRAVAAAEVEP
jgi:hypothetical protein